MSKIGLTRAAGILFFLVSIHSHPPPPHIHTYTQPSPSTHIPKVFAKMFLIPSKILIITEGCNNGKDLQWGFPTKNKNQYLTNKHNFLVSEVLIRTPHGTKNTVLTPNKITLPCIEQNGVLCYNFP